MRSNLYKCFFILFISIEFFSSCINNDAYETPPTILITYELKPTKTLEEIISQSSDVPVLYKNDDVIEAYVSSNDKESNFYNSISLQTIPKDDSAPIGFSITANFKSFAKGFVPGRKTFIKLKGLYTAIVDGSLKIGTLYEGTIGRISENEWSNYIFPSSTLLDENTFIKKVNLAEAATNEKLNTLVEIENVQFLEESLNRTYFDIDSGGGATNHSITSTLGGASHFLRVSSFAPFSKKLVPSGSGKIRGVMSKYANDFQFLVRDETDIKLTESRVFIHTPLGGSDMQFRSLFTENFSNYKVSETIFNKYINDQTAGNRYWKVQQYPEGSGNKYVEMSSFGSGGITAKTYFIVPVDFTGATTFSFKKEIRYNMGEVLKVYYVKEENYVANGPINLTFFVDISLYFNLVYPTIGYSDSSFTNSGIYSIPNNLTGKGFFVFQYSGTPEITTTIQLDDITVN